MPAWQFNSCTASLLHLCTLRLSGGPDRGSQPSPPAGSLHRGAKCGHSPTFQWCTTRLHFIGKVLESSDSSGEVAWSFDLWNVQMPPTISRKKHIREPRQCGLLPSRQTGIAIATIWRVITRNAQGTRPIIEEAAQRHEVSRTSGKNLAHTPFVGS